MQAILDKMFPNMDSEEQWTEFLALFAAAWLVVLMAAAGFMLGQLFTPYNNDLDHIGQAHYSIPGAGIGALLGLVIGISLYLVRVRAKRWESLHHAHEHSVTSPTVTDLDPEEVHEDTYL